jgi:hypothetical protein
VSDEVGFNKLIQNGLKIAKGEPVFRNQPIPLHPGLDILNNFSRAVLPRHGYPLSTPSTGMLLYRAIEFQMFSADSTVREGAGEFYAKNQDDVSVGLGPPLRVQTEKGVVPPPPRKQS